MKPLISLVVPVYNVEKYLEICMKSVLLQTYENFEVILVDDGSTDKSSKICDWYAGKDDRIIVFHKSNGGLSEARNFGVKQAHGELIAFIDSDDCITSDYLDYLWYLMKKYKADLSVGQFQRVEENNNVALEKQNSHCHDYSLNTEKALEQMCIGHDISPVAWGKLYRKEFLQRNPYPLCRYYEDIATTYKLIAEGTTIAVGTKKIYCYIQRNMSILHSTVSEDHLFGLTAAEEMCGFIQNYYPKIISASHVRCCTTALDIIIRILDNNYSNKEFYYFARKYLIRHYNAIENKSMVSLTYKIDCLFYSKGYRLSKIYRYFRKRAARIIKLKIN